MNSAKLRYLAGTIDQIFSSVSNGLVLFAIAVVSSADVFGRVSLLLTLVAAAVGVLRGALGTSLLRAAGRDEAEIRREGSHAVAGACGLSVVLAVLVLLCGVLSDVDIPAAILAIAAPIILMQDILRYVAISLGRATVAALWDGAWFVGSVALLVAAWMAPSWLSPERIVGGWCVLALVALCGMCVHLRLRPRFRYTLRWLRTDGWHRVRFGIDAGLEQVTVFAVLLLVAGLIATTAAAALRGATAVLAPLAIVASALPLLVIPEAARNDQSPAQTWKALRIVAMVTTSIALAIGIVLAVLPDSVGRLILGDTFAQTQQIIILVAAQYAASSWVTVVSIFLRSQNRSTEVLIVKIAYVVLMLTSVVVVVLIKGDALAVAIGLLAATIVTSIGAVLWVKPWRDTPCVYSPRHLRTSDGPVSSGEPLTADETVDTQKGAAEHA